VWRTVFFTATGVAVLVAGGWVWSMFLAMGKSEPIPGTTVFRTYYDVDHGMSDTIGTFPLPGGDTVSVRCWSPSVIKRCEYFDLYLHCPEKAGTERLQPVRIGAGDFSATFDGFYVTPDVHTATTLWLTGVPREQLRRIASAAQAVVRLENGNQLVLPAEDLAQIRALLAYTDTLTEYNPSPVGTARH
jgi:hypothetical protein